MGNNVSILNLEELHAKYFGIQDKYDDAYISSFAPIQHDNIVKETRTFTFVAPPNGAKFRHTMSTDNAHEAYKNINITPSSAISKIKLEIGGQTIENLNLYRFLNKDIEFYQASNGRAIPTNRFHNSVIEFETNKECCVTLSYDVVTLLYKEKEYEDRIAPIYCEQLCGPKTINCQNSSIKLGFTNPVVAIYAFLPETTVDARVLLDGVDHNLALTKKDNYHLIEFGDENSINFSKIKNAELQIKLPKTNYEHNDINIVGISKSILYAYGNGMGGISYDFD
jgi:hypothetical protein